MAGRLINGIDPSQREATGVMDAWLVAAWNVEQSLINAGAEPGRDYSMLDLYQLSQPFILKRWESGALDFYGGFQGQLPHS